jgi:hypothetical protein
MTSTSGGLPADDVPEADFAEQAVDADPAADEGGEPGQRPNNVQVGTREVDEADLADQETLAYGADDGTDR